MTLQLPFCSMDIINHFGLSKHPLLFMMGLDGCLYLDGGAAVCAALCYTAGFPETGTKRQLKLVSPLQSHKYRTVWETEHALMMLQHLGLLFLLGVESSGGEAEQRLSRVNAEGLCTVCSCPSAHLTPSKAMDLTGEPGS